MVNARNLKPLVSSAPDHFPTSTDEKGKTNPRKVPVPDVNRLPHGWNKTGYPKNSLLARSGPPSATPIPTIRGADQKSASTSEIIIFSGPGGTAFDRTETAKLEENLQKQKTPVSLQLIGDGEKNVTLSELVEKLRQIKKNGRPVTLFLQAHGDIREGEHKIQISSDEWISSKVLLEALKKEVGENYPVSVFMTACHGGGATQVAEQSLPRGSVFVALAPGTESVSGFDVERLTTALSSVQVDRDGDHWLESDEFLYVYLTHALKNRIAPEFSIAGKGNWNLQNEFRGRLGKKFTDAEKTKAHEKLDPLMGNEKVEHVLQKIESAKDEYTITAMDYGPALAIALSLIDPA